MQRLTPTYAATVAHRLTTFIFVATVAIGVYLAVSVAVGGQRGDIVFEAAAPLNRELIPKGLYTTDEQRTVMVVDGPTTRESRLDVASQLVGIVLLAAIMWFLRGIARSVRDGDPFIGDNVRRLRAIGILLIVGVLAVRYAQSAIETALIDPYLRPALDLNARGLRPPDERDFPAAQLLCGLGAVVLAQVFAHGVRLREDVDATI